VVTISMKMEAGSWSET